jgi:hypothetical protein
MVSAKLEKMIKQLDKLEKNVGKIRDLIKTIIEEETDSSDSDSDGKCMVKRKIFSKTFHKPSIRSYAAAAGGGPKIFIKNHARTMAKVSSAGGCAADAAAAAGGGSSGSGAAGGGCAVGTAAEGPKDAKDDAKDSKASECDDKNDDADDDADGNEEEGEYIVKFQKDGRYNHETFVNDIANTLTEDRVINGKKMVVIQGIYLPRKRWPLDENGKEYEKLQYLVQDFGLCVVREKDKPNMYVVIEA